jgi:hypothetical protein
MYLVKFPGYSVSLQVGGSAAKLLTLDDVQQVMSEFTMTGTESSPSAYSGTSCRFRGRSDSLKATAINETGEPE